MTGAHPAEAREPTAAALHERAAASAAETRRSVVGLATGSLAVFFLALTTEIRPALTQAEKVLMLAALTTMALTVLFGLWSAFSDAQWSYCWARMMETADGNLVDRTKFERGFAYWHRQKRWTQKAMLILFATGVVVASCYIALRAFFEH